MAIIKKFAPFQNLTNFQTFLRDTNPNSQYFRISEFADTFTGGKNGFLIEGSEFLKETTEVKIEILDVAGNPIYFEPGEGVPEYYEGNSKLISVHVYDDTPIGISKITILGELKNYVDDFGAVVPVPNEWKGVYNVKWEKSFQVNRNLNNESIVRFYKRPVVAITELIKPIFSKTVPITTDTGYVHGISEVPNDGTDITTWRAGTLYKLRRTNGVWDRDVDENTITITNPTHTANITEVLNDTEVLVNVPYTINNRVSNFTSGSFSVTYSDFQNETIGESTLTGSFAKIDISQLKTFVGDVARVKVYRKSRNAVGDFQFVQESKLESTELLRDITTTSNTEIPYGRFDETNLSTYWVTSSDDHEVSIDSAILSQAVKFDYDNVAGGVQNLITSQSFSISKDVEYTLNFKTLLSGSLDDTNKKIRAYFSSSNFTQDFTTISGSAVYRARQNVSQNIISENTGDVKLVFEVEGEDWYISNVSLKNAQDTSFSPDEFTLIQDIPRKLASETFDFRFEFYDINNNYIPVDVTAVGVFDGGNDFPTSGKLLTFESDRNAFRFSSGSVQNPTGQQIQLKVTQNNLTGSVTFASSAFDVDGNYLDPIDYSQYPGKLTSVNSAGAIITINNFTGSRVDGLYEPFVGSVVYTASLENLEEFETVYRLEDGDNAPQLIVTSNTNQFIYEPTALEPKPSGQQITIRAQRKNLASLVTELTVNSGSNRPELTYVDTVNGIDTYTLSATAFSESFSANPFDEVTYSFTGSDVFDNEQYDEITISKVINFDGVSITLSNEATAFRANGQGLVLDDFASGDGNVEVRIGNKIIEHENGLSTPNRFDITGSVPTNVTEKDASYTSDEYGVTALTQDSGSIILNIKYLAGDGVTTQSFNKKVNYTKNRIAQPSITFDTTNKTQNVDAKSTGVQLTDFDDSVLTIREFYTGSVTTFTSGDIDLVITSGSDDSAGNPLVTRSGLTLSFGDLPNGVNSTQIGLTATLTDSEGFSREVSDTISLSKTLASAPNVEFQVTPSAQTLTSNSVGGSPGSATNLVVTANEGGSARTLSALSATATGTGITITSATPATGVIVLNTSAMSVNTGTITISASTTNTEGTTITKTLTATVSKAKNAQPSITFTATPQAQTIDTKSTGELVGSITDVVISGFEGNTPLTYNQVTLLGDGEYKITNVTGVTVSDTTPNTATNGTIDITGFSGDSAVGTASISYKDSEGTAGTSSIKFTLAKAKSGAPAVLVTATPQSQNVSANELGTQTGTLTDVVVSVENGTFVDMSKTQSGFGTNPTISTNTLTMSSAIMNASEASVTLTVNYTDTEGTSGSQDIIIRCTKTNDGSVGSNGVVINLSPTSQIVKVATNGTYATPSIFTVSVSENGTLLTHTTNTTLVNNQFKIGTITNGSITAGSGTTTPDIRPTTPTAVTGLTTSFTVTYRDSQGNESSAIAQSHVVSVVLDGVTGPGVVHTGVWEAARIYQYDDGLLTGTGRRDTVLWSSDGNAPYDTYYASTRTHTSVGTNTINGAPHQSNSTAWTSLGTQDFFVAAKLGVFEESFIQNTLNIGENNAGGFSASNITLYGGSNYPYFSLGQSTAGVYGDNGIFIGNDDGNYRASFVNGTTSFMKWTGSELQIKGSITVTGGDAATQEYANTIGTNSVASGSASAAAAQTAAELFASSAASNAVVSGSNAASAAQSAAITQAQLDASASVNLLANGNWTAGSGTFITSNSISSPVIAGNAGYISTIFKVGQDGITLDGTNKKIYVGTGTYNNSNTAFYVDDSNNFSLGDSVTWDGSTFTVSGDIVGSDIEGSNINGGTVSGATLVGGSINVPNATNPLFQVNSSGVMTATDANISGEITATSGLLGNWVVDPPNAGGSLKDDTGRIILNPTDKRISLFDTNGDLKAQINASDALSSIGSGNIYISGIGTSTSAPAGVTSSPTGTTYVEGTPQYSTSQTFTISTAGEYQLNQLFDYSSPPSIDLSSKVSSLGTVTTATGNPYGNITPFYPGQQYSSTSYGRGIQQTLSLVVENNTTNAVIAEIQCSSANARGAYSISNYYYATGTTSSTWVYASGYSSNGNSWAYQTSSPISSVINFPSSGTYRVRYKSVIESASGYRYYLDGTSNTGTYSYYTVSSSIGGVALSSLDSSVLIAKPSNFIEMSGGGFQAVTNSEQYVKINRLDANNSSWVETLLQVRGGKTVLQQPDIEDEVLNVSGKAFLTGQTTIGNSWYSGNYNDPLDSHARILKVNGLAQDGYTILSPGTTSSPSNLAYAISQGNSMFWLSHTSSTSRYYELPNQLNTGTYNPASTTNIPIGTTIYVFNKSDGDSVYIRGLLHGSNTDNFLEMVGGRAHICVFMGASSAQDPTQNYKWIVFSTYDNTW
jgi:hypothetical protein